MAKQQVTVNVESSSYAVGKLLQTVIQDLAAKKPLAVVVADSLVPLEAAIAQLSSISADAKEDKVAFANGFLLPLEEAAEALWGAPAAPTA